ncbi:MAG: Aerotolerance-related exported protein [Verrucomicrobiales bacterium]|nr:Aerotolerance-related exported protein [Verrucomicrobiales bacterium]
MNALLKRFGSTSFAHCLRVVCVLFAMGAPAVAENTAEVFNNANKLYEQQKYPAAAAEYEKLLQSSNLAPEIYFNLGNAYFKSGQLGRGIAAYRNAELLAPRDPNIRANLQFARNEANKKSSQSLWTEVIHTLTLNEWAIAAAVCIWLVFGLLILSHWRTESKKLLRIWSAVIGVIGLFFVVCLGSAFRDRFLITSAVVVVQEAVVRRGPVEESQSAFTLRDGAEIFVLNRKDKWLQVVDASRRIGWLPESQVIVLNGGQ